ncbi:unnamed protein product [Closterium sp. NIES-53]
MTQDFLGPGAWLCGWSCHAGWSAAGQLAGGWYVWAKQADVERRADVPVSREEEVGGNVGDHVADAKWPAVSRAEFWGDGQAEVDGECWVVADGELLYANSMSGSCCSHVVGLSHVARISSACPVLFAPRSACCAAIASLRVLAFDYEDRPIQFDTWLDDLQLYLLSDSRDSVSLFDLASGTSPAPPATADGATRSQWLTRDAAARLAICNHLQLAECAHFRQHRTAQALYDDVVSPYSSPATTALGRLLLPYLFPKLSAFATVKDLVSLLRASDARYRAALPAKFLDKNPPPIAVAVGAACGTPRTPFFEGCSPSPLGPSYASAAAVHVLGAEDVGADSARAKRRSSKDKGGRGGGGGSRSGGGGSSGGSGRSGGGGCGGSGGGSGGVGGGGEGSGGSVGSGSGGSGGGRTGAQNGGSGGGQRQQQQRRSKTPSPQQLRKWFAQRGASGGSVSCPYVICTGDRAGQTCGKAHTQHRCFSRLDDAWRAEFGDEVERPHWAELLRSSVAIFDLDYDAILSAMYALSASAEGDYYRCVPPDPGIDATALSASESVLRPRYSLRLPWLPP